jgi:hypothetical protein
MSVIFEALGVAFVLSLIPVAFFFVRAYRESRGPRVVVCPETMTPEGVGVDPLHAAWSTVVGEKDLRIASCTRWPERQECGQTCLAQIESQPDGCLLFERLTAWYENARCGICERPTAEVSRPEHVPGLLGLDGTVREWREIALEDFPEVLGTHRALCGDCYAERSRPSRPTRDVFTGVSGSIS